MIKIACILIKNLVVSFILLFTMLIAQTHAQSSNCLNDEDIARNEAYYDCVCVEKNCLIIDSTLIHLIDPSILVSSERILIDAILTNSAVVANEVQASKLKTFNSIKEMQKDVTNFRVVLSNYYQNHFAVLQKLMLEKINTIAKDPSWSQESYEALKLRLIKDLSDVFESKHE